MKRLLVIFMLMAFVTGASASEKQCKECEATWLRWFVNTAALSMAYLYASSKIPPLERFNGIALSKGGALASSLSVWVMAQWAKKTN